MHPMPISVRARLLAVAALSLLLNACASTTLSSEWKNPNYTGGPIRKLAVFVMTPDDNLRRFAEDQAVQRLPKGTVGVAGYTMFPKVSEGDKDKVRARLVQDGFDGAMVTRLVSNDKTQTYVPPQTYLVPAGPSFGAGPYYGSFYGYYGYASTYAYTTPGYTMDVTTVVVETLLYKLPEDTVVWTGTTQTVNPQSKPEMVQAIVKIVETELAKEGLLGTPAK